MYIRDTVNICGVEIDSITMRELLDVVCDAVDNKKCVYVVAPNVDHIIKLQKDADFRRVYSEATLVLPDGMPLLWAASFLGKRLREKISGSDLVPFIAKQTALKGYRLFFMGGRPGAADLAREKLERRYPGVNVVGTYCPPIGFENDPVENRKIIELIRACHPDILFVGVGAPKQEKWINKHFREAGVPFNMGVGVTFEFAAGLIMRAPKWLRKLGLEWAWRLMMEPTRLFKRYIIDDTRFFWLVLKQKLQSKHKARNSKSKIS